MKNQRARAFTAVDNSVEKAVSNFYGEKLSTGYPQVIHRVIHRLSTGYPQGYPHPLGEM